MNKQKIITLVFCMMLVFPAMAQNVLNDTTVNAIKVKELTMKKTTLEKQIKIEDGKRNQAISGVSVETQEKLNDQQDSICLALRSQLVSIELEIRELTLDKTEDAIINQFNKLQKNDRSGNAVTGRGNTDK